MKELKCFMQKNSKTNQQKSEHKYADINLT